VRVSTAWHLIAAGLTLAAFFAATHMRTDADLWGHVRFGLDTLQTWSLPADDPYSFTQDTPWINHEWLSELQMGLAWKAGGTAGLALLKGSLTFAAFVLIWTALRQVHPGARLGILAVVVFGTVHMWSSLRPQLWTLVSFAVLCRILVGGSAKSRRWLPVLFAVWTNNHGGWIVGIGVLTVWAAAKVIAEREPLREWAMVTLLSILATLATPYGWTLWEFVLRTVRLERAIAEWRPLWTAHPLNWLPWALAVAAGVWTAFRMPAHRVAAAAVLAMLAGASLQVQRLESIFVTAAAILLVPAFARQWPARAMPFQAGTSRADSAVAAAVFVVTAVFSGWMASFTLRCIPTGPAWAADREAMRWLKSAGEGRMVTFFDWGEYAIWHLQPRVRVSMDGRRETVYSEQRIAENKAIVNGTAEGLNTLAAWRPEYVWLPATSVAAKNWLAGNGYRLDTETGRSFVAVRDDVPRLVPAGAFAGNRPCFPE
jgi:hypothetical protein